MERDLNIDLIKCIAMINVVCLHTTHYYLSGDSFYIAAFLYRNAVIAIPLFFMVSGYLLLGRSNISFGYSAKKIFGIIKFVFIITAGWWLTTSVIHGHIQKGFLTLFLGAFIQRGTFSVFWYFGAMCILYAVYPFINWLYLRKDHTFWLLLASIGVIQSFGFISNLTECGGGEASVCQSFRLWNWLSYFLLGGAIKKFKSFSGCYIAIICIVFFIFNPFIQQLLIPHIGNDYCEYFYSALYVVAGTVAVFLCLNGVSINNTRMVKVASGLFLPVYAIHKIVILVLSPTRFNLLCTSIFGDGAAAINYISSLLYFLAILSITFLLSWIVMRTPVLNKVFKI